MAGTILIHIILTVLFVLPNTDALDESPMPERLLRTKMEHRNHTAISDFRVINRRQLPECSDPNPYVQVNISSAPLGDDVYVTVNVTGVTKPLTSDWVAMISPSHSDITTCVRNAFIYTQTGDFSTLPLLCHYPVKAQYLSSDSDYLRCKKKECKKHDASGKCILTTCGATLSFHVVNIRSDIEFVMFGGGFAAPCIMKRSESVSFANPKKPLYGHISSIDSTATSMKLRWVSGDQHPQQVQYNNGQTATSSVTTFSQADMCTSSIVSPAVDFGWHDPGYIHSAVMTPLKPSTSYSYRYGSDSVGWSDKMTFKTPPAGGSNELKFLAYGDMGKAPLDSSLEHYIQPGSVSVTKGMAREVSSGNVDSIFHIGDISYATGFLVEWDYFLQLINPLASKVPYMTSIGNHERYHPLVKAAQISKFNDRGPAMILSLTHLFVFRDYIGSGSVYILPDSGGECGVPYETYFPMPTLARDKPWYSIEQGSVHFTVISTEHDFNVNSEQYEWMSKDMASVDRTRTPWLIFTGHRSMYTSTPGLPIFPNVDPHFVNVVEPLLLLNKVDFAMFGHVHNYERTCAIYKKQCKGIPVKDRNGIDTYHNANYTAPVHVVIGMAGFKLDDFTQNDNSWSLVRITEYGYIRAHATKKDLKIEFVNAKSGKVDDSFRITKS